MALLESWNQRSVTISLRETRKTWVTTVRRTVLEGLEARHGREVTSSVELELPPFALLSPNDQHLLQHCMLLRPFLSFFSPSRTSPLFPSRSLHSRLLRSAPAMLLSDQTIQLTPEEDRLCSLLQQFKQHVEATEPDSPQVECRIAGGWVRDKVSFGGLREEI